MVLFWVLFCVFCVLVALNLILPKLIRRHDTSITFLVGEIGAGKSAYSVMLARRALRSGRPVYCTDYIRGCNRFDISWLESMKCPENSLLIIDESALKFNSRDFAKINKAIIAYFKKCRHFRNDVVLISQTFSDTDKQIRELSTKILFLRKFGFLTLPVRVRGDVTVDSEGQPCMKYKIGRFARPFIPMIQGKYYDSWEDSSNRQLCPCIPWDEPESESIPDMDKTDELMDFPDVPSMSDLAPSDELLYNISKLIR